MRKTAVGVVLVNWNGLEDTLHCIASIERSAFRDHCIYVVDNASADESVEVLGQLGGRIVLIANGRNDGWAGGCNIGVRRALADGCEHVFLLNNDAEVWPDTLDRLLAAQARLGPQFALGCVVVDWASGENQFFGALADARTGTPAWLDHRADAGFLAQDHIDTTLIYGAAAFIRAEHFRQVGLFDERFFLNYDETDWCARALEAGVRLAVVTGAIVDHRASSSIGGRDSPLQTYFLCRNELLFASKHGAPAQRRAVRVRLARTIARGLRGELRSGDRSLARTRAAARGVVDFALGRFGDCPAHIRRLSARWRATPAPGTGAGSLPG